MAEHTQAVFVTFYSFKGGVGRSMALVNTGGILASRRGFRVLVIDLDLEAPGLSYLTPNAREKGRQQAAAESFAQPGFVDLLTDAKQRGPEADLFTLSPEEIGQRYTREYSLPDELRQFKDGSLHIMPAGMFDGKYATRLDTLDLPELYREGLGEPLVRAFKEKLAGSGLYDYVLIDSRTGFSDEAGICTRDLADHLMILSGLNRQNVEGTAEFLRALRIATDGKKRFEIILSPIPTGEDKLFEEREAAAKSSFEAAWRAEVNLSLQIPYHPQLALTEEPHIFRRRRGPLSEAYEAIESAMLRSLGHHASAFRQLVLRSLQHREFRRALTELKHMIRLDGGRNEIRQLAEPLAWNSPVSRRAKSETKATEISVSLSELLKQKDGVEFVAFVVENMPLAERDWMARQLLQRLVNAQTKLADVLLQRLIKTFPEDVQWQLSYAHLLESRGDASHALQYFERMAAAHPSDAIVTGQFATFLDRVCHDAERAEKYYRTSIDALPVFGAKLGDFGQLLIGTGRLEEGQDMLESAFEHLDASDKGNLAEVCFSLWLVNRMRGKDAEVWERRFKFMIETGFRRHPWDFDRMLRLAQTVLAKAEYEYATALAAAFLSKNKVNRLRHYERWVGLRPLPPKNSEERGRKRKPISTTA